MTFSEYTYPIGYTYEQKKIGQVAVDILTNSLNNNISWSQLRKMMKIYADNGIFIEYDWYGHRGEFFLATRFDAMAQQEALDSYAEKEDIDYE